MQKPINEIERLKLIAGLINEVNYNDTIYSVNRNTKTTLTEAKEEKVLSIDVANPYEFRHGLQYELDQMNDYSDEALEKAKVKVLKNLTKDANFYFNLLNQQPTGFEFKAPETDAPGMQANADGTLKKGAGKLEKANVQDSLGKKEEGTSKPKGVKVMPDKGVTGSEKTIKEGLETSDLEVKWTEKYLDNEKKDPYFYGEKGLASDFEMADGKKVKEIVGYFEDEDGDEDYEVIGHIYSKSGKDIETEYSEDDLDDAFTGALGSMNEGDGVASNKVDDMIKSGKIKPEEVKVAAEKAMKGDSTSLIALMAGLKLSEDKVEEGKSNKQKLIDAGYSESDAEDFADEFEQGGVKVPQKVKDILTVKIEEGTANKYISVEIEGNEQFPILNKVLISDYLKTVIDPSEIESVDAFMDDEEGFDESSSYFFDNDEENASEKDVEDWAKQEMSYYLFSKPDEFPGKGDIMEVDAPDDLNPNELSDENTFEDLMKKYDWYYEMSDDPREYNDGTALDKQLKSLAKSIGIDRAVELFNQYAPSDRKVTTSFFQMNEDKHAKLKELLKTKIKEVISAAELIQAKQKGQIVKIPKSATTDIQSAERAKANYSIYE